MCNDKQLECKLLAEKDLTFQQAFTIAKAIEAAEKEAKDLQQHSTAPVNSIHSIHGGKRMVSKPISTPPQDPRVPGIACHRC